MNQAESGRPGRGHRQAVTRGAELRGNRRKGRVRGCADSQRQAERGILGNAHFLQTSQFACARSTTRVPTFASVGAAISRRSHGRPS